jgi:hypothetical protein
MSHRLLLISSCISHCFSIFLPATDREGLRRTKFCESLTSGPVVKDGRLVTLSQTANNPASVYVFAVRRISLCRMIFHRNTRRSPGEGSICRQCVSQRVEVGALTPGIDVPLIAVKNGMTLISTQNLEQAKSAEHLHCSALCRSALGGQLNCSFHKVFTEHSYGVFV